MTKRVNRDDVDYFHDVGLYVPTRTLYTESECDGQMAERLIKNLHVLETMSSTPITIVMNNIGGDEYDCFAIIDAIRACDSEVTIKVFGAAMSAGSMILQAADYRVMAPNATQMIHYGTWGNHDHSKTYQKHAKEGIRIDKAMEQLYLRRIKEKNPAYKLQSLRSMLDHDTYLTAEQSVDLGLADAVLEVA